MKAILKKSQTKEQVAETLRLRIVKDALYGRMCCINCESTTPTVKDYQDGAFQHDFVFDAAKFMNRETQDYKKILKAGEDKDKDGKAGLYDMGEDFGICFVFNMKDEYMDDKMCKSLLDSIAHIDQFTKIYINPEK